MKQNYDSNIAHILDEFERINRLIAVNIPHILEEKGRQKSEVRQPSLDIPSLEEFERITQLISANITNTLKNNTTEKSEIEPHFGMPSLEEFEDINRLIASNFPNPIKKTINENPPDTQPFGIPLWAIKKFKQPGLKEEIAELRNKIDTKIENSPKTNELRLLKLKLLFNLSPEEFDIFLICLIGEFDAHYQAMWSDLQNNSNEKHPSIEIILNLLSTSLAEKLKLKTYLQNESNLFKYYLLECTDTKSCLAGLTLHQRIMVSPRILNYLLGDDNIIPILSSVLKFVSPSKVIKDLHLPENLLKQIGVLIESRQTFFASENPCIITLQGKEDSGQQMVAESICKMLEINMLIVNTDYLLSNQLSELPIILSMIRREAILQNSSIYWQNAHLLSASDKSSALNLFTNRLGQFQGLHFFVLTPYEYFPFHKIKSTLVHLEIPNLTTRERFQLWQGVMPELSADDIAEIAQSFQLGRGQIYDVVTHAQALFKENGDKLSKEGIYQICHAHAHQHLSKYAKLVKPLYKLENIILPQECKQELEEIIAWIKYKEIVYEKGGFNKKVSLGKGLITLFFGPPGTGKTMAAEVIANSLNLLLYKIDLSSVLSKYVGETEQHLDKVFNEAENSNAILFFDEADSLFGKRGEVKDARDNYANIQTSYLLQKVEEYSGMVILATNFKHNMDEAFVRRLHFSVDFPFPQPDQRHKIWQQIWPQEIKLDDSIDLKKLADGIEIAGGNIRNIALAAAFKAVSEQIQSTMPIKITKEQLVFAIKRELRKMGRIIIHEQLNKFFEI